MRWGMWSSRSKWSEVQLPAPIAHSRALYMHLCSWEAAQRRGNTLDSNRATPDSIPEEFDAAEMNHRHCQEQ